MTTETKTLIKTLSEVFGSSFVGLRGYTSVTSGEIANHTINVGFSYENAVKKDIVKLESTSFEDSEMEAMRVKMLTSLKKNLNPNTKSNSSIGQSEAYIHIGNGVKFHCEKKELYIYGMAINKKVIVEATKPRKYSHNDNVKKAVSDACGLSTTKYRNFKFSMLDVVKISGNELSFK